MIRVLTVFFILLFSVPIQAKDLSDFGAWPVLHDGRVKTMESFARANFYKISGATETDEITALEWVAESVFDPSTSITRQVIHVDRVPLLELPERVSKLYTLNEVMEAMRPHQDLVLSLQTRDPSMLSAPQSSLLNVYQALVIYNQIIQSFSAVLPINDGDKTYLDGAGEDVQRALIEAGGADNNLLRFIPHDDPQNPMISVWKTIKSGGENPTIDQLTKMAKVWKNDDGAWELTAGIIKNDLQGQIETSFALTLEHFYVTINPILFSIIFYIIGFIFLNLNKILVSFPRKRESIVLVSLGSRLRGNDIGGCVIVVGAIIHALALIMRSIILERPPTGTIYETFLFSSFIIIAFGLIVFFKNKNRLFLGGSVVCALMILLISRFFIEGDSLNVLVAVLNTNFWLATHVTCIIIGYALCVIAAMSGHLYLMTNDRKAKNMMVPLALVALLFTAIGTLLGGIWADQSWGRFWGWDPKENGALVIVLWLAWILHGRISGHFNMRGFACALAMTNITVAVTWFGVNLLGVGLHSYGFISGIAWGLGIFCTLQGVIAGVLYVRHKRIYP